MRQTAVLSGLLAFGTLFPATGAFAADPQLLKMVMPDAKILAGVNATSAEASPFGQFIISKLGLMGAEPQKFIAATGFNPLQDVSEILAATSADPSNPGGLVLATGKFPVDKFVAAVSGNANLQVQTYNGATLIGSMGPNEKAPHAVAFIGATMAVAGDLTSVKAAIDRGISGSPGSIDAALLAKATQLSASEDEWVASSTSVASLIPASAQAAAPSGPAAQVLPLFKNIQAFNGGVKFGPSVAFTGEALMSDPNNAAALQAVIRLGITLVSSNTSITSANPQLAGVVQLLQTLAVSTNGPAVDLSLSIPEVQLEGLVNSAPAHARAIATVHGRSPEFHHGN
jgi:hypothetical protein